MGFRSILSATLQLVAFYFLTLFFLEYYGERKGIEHSDKILKGAKMYHDENGVTNN
jgi:hypothetical protein